jgi:hypothetical protein
MVKMLTLLLLSLHELNTTAIIMIITNGKLPTRFMVKEFGCKSRKFFQSAVSGQRSASPDSKSSFFCKNRFAPVHTHGIFHAVFDKGSYK